MANIQDCIFYNISNEAVIDDNATPTNEHNTYFNCGTALKLTNTSLSSPVVKNNIYHDCTIDSNVIDSNGLTALYCIHNGLSYNTTYDSNSLANKNPLFLDEKNVDFRLAKKARGYFVDSLAMGLSDDSRDCGAIDETVVRNDDTWEEFEFLDPPKSGNLSLEPQNLVSNIDILGNLREYWDSINRVWQFDFTDYVRRGQSFKLLNFMQSETNMKFFPLGGETLIDDIGSGVFDATNLTFTFSSNYTIPINWFKGFWLSIYDGSDWHEFYITSNVSNVFYLSNKTNSTLASGNYECEITYMLVRLVHDPVIMNFPYFLNFQYGQALGIKPGEDGRGLTKLETYNNYTLKFKEIDNFSY